MLLSILTIGVLNVKSLTEFIGIVGVVRIARMLQVPNSLKLFDIVIIIGINRINGTNRIQIAAGRK